MNVGEHVKVTGIDIHHGSTGTIVGKIDLGDPATNEIKVSIDNEPGRVVTFYEDVLTVQTPVETTPLEAPVTFTEPPYKGDGKGVVFSDKLFIMEEAKVSDKDVNVSGMDGEGYLHGASLDKEEAFEFIMAVASKAGLHFESVDDGIFIDRPEPAALQSRREDIADFYFGTTHDKLAQPTRDLIDFVVEGEHKRGELG